jgi:aldose 1-epimerase
MQIDIQNTTLTQNKKEIFICSLQHSNGTIVKITNYGAIIMSFEIVKDDKVKQDIVLGFDTVDQYWGVAYRAAYPYFGAIIGRYANRIKDAKFTLNNKEYLLAKNLGEDNLHGGPKGFDSKVWAIVDSGALPQPFVKLQHISPHMEEGFPGELTTTILYTLLANELQYEITATTNQDTIINMAQHTYFNLNEDLKNITTHQVKINATQYFEQDEALNATGNFIDIKNTPFDFTDFKSINKNWDHAKGYDQSFLISNHNDTLQLAAECYNEKQDLKLEVYTTAPVVHLYTGRWIPNVKGKKGILYGAYSGLCFETQHHLNAINIPHFPSTILKPREQYYQKNSYRVVSNVVKSVEFKN